ncbi:CGNR zinc finger domain-containing protein [Halalkalibacter urbisdiaboli]|uniref:CGNR zinc finger domain-containing protein n=1 Tax=Halalkalibacter urbisdiaboli TaxID=1960589 RepID=UPI000B4482AF|nr:CGNR zinc finger domain-containing protein [Halalkalibacter urbisdiaboli]
MAGNTKFPLFSGHLSLDLVNTEVVRNGARIDLLTSHEDLITWIHTMDKKGILSHKQIPENIEEWAVDALPLIKDIRESLREVYEGFADDKKPKMEWIKHLESLINKAPFTYLLEENVLIAKPVGKPEDALIALLAYDAMRLFAENKLTNMHRCANPDCVLLFIDTRGRRKWCSMKICGNREKVTRHQKRKNLQE